MLFVLLVRVLYSPLCSQPIAIYSHFKRLASELSLALFLGMDVEEVDEMVDLVVQLGKTHWHGEREREMTVPLLFWMHAEDS